MKENPFSPKAIIIGVLIQIVVSLLLVIFVFASITSITVHGANLTNEGDVFGVFLNNPKLIFITLLGLLLGNGLPGYIAARIANKNYILHGAIIGLIASVWSIRTTFSEIYYPLLFGLSLMLLEVAASTAGGWYRGWQIENKIKNS